MLAMCQKCANWVPGVCQLGAGWCQVVPGGARWCQVVPARWCRMVPGVCQMVPRCVLARC